MAYSDVSGATSTSYTIPSSAADGDKYRISWTRNSVQEYASNNVVVTAASPPPSPPPSPPSGP